MKVCLGLQSLKLGISSELNVLREKNDWALTFSAYKKIRGEEAKEFTKEIEVELKAFLTMGTANGNFLRLKSKRMGMSELLVMWGNLYSVAYPSIKTITSDPLATLMEL